MEKLVVDTNVLIDTPEILLDNEFQYLIPYIVLQELDGLKKNIELSYAVRNAIKIIYQQMKSGKVQIINLPTNYGTNDEKIVKAAKKEQCPLLTQDIGAMAVAKARGVAVIEDDTDDGIENYVGYTSVTADISYESYVPVKEMQVEELNEILGVSLNVNEYVLINRVGGKTDIWKEDAGKAVRVSQSSKPFKDSGVMITPIDEYQMAAWDAVLSDVPLTIIEGRVGSSKTLSALVGLLARVTGQKRFKKYRKIYYTRAPIPVDKSLQLGFAPGPQPLNSVVMTPQGPNRMQDITIGDEVCTPSGTRAVVTHTQEFPPRPVYKLTLSDGSSCEAGDTHMWRVTMGGKERDFSTTDLLYWHNRGARIVFPDISPVVFDKQELPIPPYTLGALLGDGTFTSAHVRLACQDKDNEIIQYVNDEVSVLGCKIGEKCKGNINYTITISDDQKRNPVLKALKDLGLHGKTSSTKFIPPQYKIGSVEQRQRVLQGLIDTDGSLRPSGECNFYTTSEQLANDVAELVASLGGSYNISSRDRRGIPTELVKTRNHKEYIVGIANMSMNPARLKRKANNFISANKRGRGRRRTLSDIKYVSTETVKCITINDKDHLYLTDNYIPTHNSILEKSEQWIAGISSNLKFLFGEEEGLEILAKHFEFVSLESIQGLSLQEDEALFVDEYQLLSRDMLKQVLSRVGEGGKVVLAGDPAGQVYGINRSREGFKVLHKVLGTTKLINYVQLNNVYRSEFVDYIDELFEK